LPATGFCCFTFLLLWFSKHFAPCAAHFGPDTPFLAFYAQNSSLDTEIFPPVREIFPPDGQKSAV
jgi:hypothetical protein